MLTISNKLKERFCKDCRIPIKVFDEPYFTQRLEILDDFFDTKSKWNQFLQCLEKYKCEQDFFEDYNRVKQAMIDYIKAAEGYEKFNSEDMNKYCNTLKKFTLPKGISSDIYKSSNVGKYFISFDIKKANFTALKHYGGIFDEFDKYEDFVAKFTDNQHFIESKYIREVIFGNCNPKRHITYERHLVDKFLSFLYDRFLSLDVNLADNLGFVSNDEVIINCDSFDVNFDFGVLTEIAKEFKEKEGVEFKPEFFLLQKISGDTSCYVKSVHAPEATVDFKCCSSNDIHCVIKFLARKTITDDDLVFVHEGRLAQLLNPPQFKVGV